MSDPRPLNDVMQLDRLFHNMQHAGISAQELAVSMQQLSDEVVRWGRACCLYQLREGLQQSYTDDEIRALLQIASKGRVHREDRVRAPRGLADGRLLALGRALETLYTQERCSIAELTDLVNAGVARATAPLPGSICEVCFDAPAVLVVPAAWGGEMGICGACVEAP